MARQTADQIGAKWSRNLGAAGQSIKDGVNAVTVSPMQQALKQIDNMRANFNAAIDSGKVARGLQRRSLEDWKQAVLTKGVARIQQGAQQGQQNMTQFMSQWMPYIDGVSQRIAQMPKGGMTNALARIQANLEAAMAFKRQ